MIKEELLQQLYDAYRMRAALTELVTQSLSDQFHVELGECASLLMEVAVRIGNCINRLEEQTTN